MTMTITCPPWCTKKSNHDLTGRDASVGAVMHTAPDFGTVQVCAWDDGDMAAGELHVQVPKDEWCLGSAAEWLPTATELRRLSADALAAAEWVEANVVGLAETSDHEGTVLG